jgi:hypothetical protein
MINAFPASGLHTNHHDNQKKSNPPNHVFVSNINQAVYRSLNQ